MQDALACLTTRNLKANLTTIIFFFRLTCTKKLDVGVRRYCQSYVRKNCGGIAVYRAVEQGEMVVFLVACAHA